MKHLQIAIDGPSGAGKSTMAKRIAAQLGLAYLDTGAMYRAVALKAIQSGIAYEDADDIAAMAEHTRIDVVYQDGAQHVLLDDRDVSGEIRTNAVSMGASRVSAIPAVRVRLVRMQQEIASRTGVVMDGRDIGTHVLPQADVKIFLTASAEDRARRRYEELQEKGMLDKSFEALAEEIRQRDHNDSTRAASPLTQAQDAILLDTTGMSIEEAATRILDIVRTRMETRA